MTPMPPNDRQREHEAADRERAAGHFDPPRRGFAELPDVPKSRLVWCVRVVLYGAGLIAAGLVGKWLGSP